MTRRGFIATTAAAGCGWAESNEGGAVIDGARATSVDGSVAGDSLLPTCGDLTAPNIEGPFFLPGSPAATDLRKPGLVGNPLQLIGRVRSAGCVPIAGAVLDFWQADSKGVYDQSGHNLRGHQYTGPDGSFQLATFMPGHYPSGDTFRPAHLHVTVAASGFMLLTTQLYFAGDPYNAADPFILDSLIISLTRQGGAQHGRFDFVLPAV